MFCKCYSQDKEAISHSNFSLLMKCSISGLISLTKWNERAGIISAFSLTLKCYQKVFSS